MEYLIGAGALLEAGESASISPATLHARVDPLLAGRVSVAAIDFEGASVDAMRKLVIVVSGWNAGRFEAITRRFLTMGDCSLADVLATVAQEAGASVVDVFAHWVPDDRTVGALSELGIELVAHPLESIQSAALVSGQRHVRWRAFRAA